MPDLDPSDTTAQSTDAQPVSLASATFRVRRSRAIQLAVAGVVAALVISVALVMARVAVQLPVLPFMAAAAVGGWLLGRTMRSDYCSRPDCGGALPVGASQCPKCNQPVRGEIEKASEHFAALEAFERAQKSERAATPE